MALNFGGLFGKTEKGITGKTKTKILAFSGYNFYVKDETIQNSKLNGVLLIEQDGVSCGANVSLPNNSVINSVIVYGNASASVERWDLFRHDITLDSLTSVASAKINSKATNIYNGIIDNERYVYFISTTTLATNDQLWGAVISYTETN